jgi:antitoxin PrlF
MTTLTITAKGQITLKKELLQHLALHPGDKVEVTPAPGGRLTLTPQRRARTGRIEDAVGVLHRPGQKPLSIEEMNEVIARGWAGELDL